MNENTLIENAILAFLHHYPEHDWVNDYKLLLTKVRKTKDEQSKTPTVQKRGRPAKRQRKKATSSIEASKEKVETPKE
tara:strand:+ start:17 stop:250 length:234 start_codon:yes stop_codon:yes gene_type:complete